MERSVWICLMLVALTASVQAQNIPSGVINFNVGSSPTNYKPPQPVTLFGCNNTTFNTTVNWDTNNQVVVGVPYGFFSSESGKNYFVSKYYIASPPAYRSATDKQHPVLGLVTPDRFVFLGKQPAQIVNLDYKILKPVYLHDVPVDFNYEEEGRKSCSKQKVTSIPINTVCKDFPWNIGTEGASGIGQLSSDGGTAFLPLLKKESEPLNCDVTLLDDVVLDHQVYFSSGRGLTKTVNLTELYKASQSMKLVCIPRERNDVPAGCAPPPGES